MIQQTEGDILKVKAEALVNPVNCVGVSGRGLALQFKQAYPANYEIYREWCKRGTLRLGQVLLTVTDVDSPRYIINFPTKHHWRDRSRLVDIESGLRSLVWIVRDHEIASLAVPALGCGLGGLPWRDVHNLMTRELSVLTVEVYLFLPKT